MAITLGTIAVDSQGVATGSGERKTLYDALAAAFPVPAGPTGAPAKQNLAVLADVFASYAVDLLTVRARAKVSTTDTGLQRMPAATTENTECKGPAADKLLVIV